MANKIVEKYDEFDNLIKVFPSIQDCVNEDGISDYLIRKKNSKKNMVNGAYYIILPHMPYYVKAICDWCGKEFDCQRFRTESRTNLFCGKKCEGQFRKSQTESNCICEVCGKPYHMKQSYIDRYESKYCSIECHRKAKKTYMKGEGNHQYGLKGDENPTWRSDERISYYGYKLIRCLDHPFKNCDDFVFEHRLVAEKYLLDDNNSTIIDGKKYLSSDFVAHHIDFDRLNNDVNNLMVMPKGEHMRLHDKLRRSDKELSEYCVKYNLDINAVKANMKNSPKYKKAKH